MGTSTFSHITRLPVNWACFSKFGEDKNLRIIQSPISLLYLAMAMKVGSMRLLLMLTRDARRSNWLLILSIVYRWLAMTLSTEEKLPEQIFDSTSKAVFFCSLAMKCWVRFSSVDVDSVSL